MVNKTTIGAQIAEAADCFQKVGAGVGV